MRELMREFRDGPLNQGVVVHKCNPITQEIKAGGARDQDHPPKYIDFKANLRL